MNACVKSISNRVLNELQLQGKFCVAELLANGSEMYKNKIVIENFLASSESQDGQPLFRRVHMEMNRNSIVLPETFLMKNVLWK